MGLNSMKFNYKYFVAIVAMVMVSFTGTKASTSFDFDTEQTPIEHVVATSMQANVECPSFTNIEYAVNISCTDLVAHTMPAASIKCVFVYEHLQPNSYLFTKHKSRQMKKVLLPVGVTQDQLNAWQKKYGDDFHVLTVKTKKEEIKGCFHTQLDRQDFAQLTTLQAQSAIAEMGEYVLTNMWLGGDERLRDYDTKIGQSAMLFAKNAVQVFEGTLGNS